MFTPSVLWKAFDVLGSFADTRRALTLSELSRRSGLPKSTTHRILLMLLEVKAVERAGQRYRMGLRMFSIGACSPEVELRSVALPHLERLRQITHQTVSLAVLESHDAVYLEKLTPGPREAIATPAVIGGRIHAHTTGVGKALLAYAAEEVVATQPLTASTSATITDLDTFRRELHRIREVGFAVDREETVKGLACVAGPIRVGGRAVAAVSVAYPVGSGSGQALVTSIRDCAASISRSLAAHPECTFE